MKCLKCGQCCFFLCNNKVMKCRHLTKENLCDTYETRLGRVLCVDRKAGTKVCILRKDDRRRIKNCPFNP